MSLRDALSGWDFLPADPDPLTCPECGGDLEETWVRAPSQQDHWRGVRALQCADCGHVERPPDE